MNDPRGIKVMKFAIPGHVQLTREFAITSMPNGGRCLRAWMTCECRWRVDTHSDEDAKNMHALHLFEVS